MIDEPTVVSGLSLTGSGRPGRFGVWRTATTSDGQSRGALLIDPALYAGQALIRMIGQVVAVRNLAAPGILPIADLVTESGRVWMITEEPATPTIAELLAADSTGDADDAVAVAMWTGQTLVALHSAGLTHGALGPQSVVLTSAGAAALIEVSLKHAEVEDDVRAWSALLRHLADRWGDHGLTAAADIAEHSGLEPALRALTRPAEVTQGSEGGTRLAPAPAFPSPVPSPEAAADTADPEAAADTGDTEAPKSGSELQSLQENAEHTEFAERLLAENATMLVPAAVVENATVLVPAQAVREAQSVPVPAMPMPDEATVLVPARPASTSASAAPAAPTPPAAPVRPADSTPPPDDPSGIRLRFGGGVPAHLEDVWRNGVPTAAKPVKNRTWRKAVGAAMVAVVLAAGIGYAWWYFANPMYITAIRVAPANPPDPACDVTVDVVGMVKTNGRPGTIRYQWVRSDGETTPQLTQTVPHGVKAVPLHLHWKFVGQGTYTATATLKILEPTSRVATSQFTYTCR